MLPSTSALDHLAMHEQVRLTGGRCPRCRAGHRFEAVGFDTTRRRRRRNTRTFENAYDQSSEAFAELEALG